MDRVGLDWEGCSGLVGIPLDMEVLIGVGERWEVGLGKGAWVEQYQGSKKRKRNSKGICMVGGMRLLLRRRNKRGVWVRRWVVAVAVAAAIVVVEVAAGTAVGVGVVEAATVDLAMTVWNEEGQRTRHP